MFWRSKPSPNYTLGFAYADGAARRREFRLAQAYFKKFPAAVKISRKQWAKLYPDNPPHHSYLKRDDGTILAIAHGPRSMLGRGASGRVKYAMDAAGGRYALKIERTNVQSQKNEADILKTIGLLHGNKVDRVLDKSESMYTRFANWYSANKDKKVDDGHKYYSTLSYLGESVYEHVVQGTRSFDEKMTLARKMAWAVHKLHADDYIHYDLKLENFVIAKNGRVRLIDFGFTEKVFDKSERSLIRLSANFGDLKTLIPQVPAYALLAGDVHYIDIYYRSTKLSTSTFTPQAFEQLSALFPAEEDVAEVVSPERFSEIKSLLKHDEKWVARYRGTLESMPTTDMNRKNINVLKCNIVSERVIIQERMQRLGEIGIDTFALERTLYQPSWGLFTTPEYARLSSALKAMLKTQNPEDRIGKNDTPLKITFNLIVAQMKRLDRLSLSDEHQESICNCFALLDEVNECEENMLPFLTADEIKRYQLDILACAEDDLPALKNELNTLIDQSILSSLIEKIKGQTIDGQQVMLATTIDEYKRLAGLTEPRPLGSVPVRDSDTDNDLKQKLTSFSNCLSLLDEISKQAIGNNDTGMEHFIAKYKDRINNPADYVDLVRIEKELTDSLESCESYELQAAKHEMDRLYAGSQNRFTFYKERMRLKAEAIETALTNVPVEERLHVFSNDSSVNCLAVRKALASNRSNQGKELNPDGVILEEKAAESFKVLKRKHTEWIEQSKDDVSTVTESLTGSNSIDSNP